MALVHEFESAGNWLFRRRSWLPVFLVVAGVYVLYINNRQAIIFNPVTELIFLAVSLAGEAIRVFTVGFAARNTSGRNTSAGQVADELNVSGIYSMVRHPLYIGNFLMWLGPVLFVRTPVFILIFILAYWLYYERIMFAEEQFLRNKFGKLYDSYSENVKAVIPRFRGLTRPALPFSVKSVLGREYNSFVNIFIIFLLLDVLRNYFLTDRWYVTPMWMYICIPAGITWIVLRVLHKRTGIIRDLNR